MNLLASGKIWVPKSAYHTSTPEVMCRVLPPTPDKSEEYIEFCPKTLYTREHYDRNRHWKRVVKLEEELQAVHQALHRINKIPEGLPNGMDDEETLRQIKKMLCHATIRLDNWYELERTKNEIPKSPR